MRLKQYTHRINDTPKTRESEWLGYVFATETSEIKSERKETKCPLREEHFNPMVFSMINDLKITLKR